MPTIFFSYSHKDEDLRDRLEVHLATLKRQGAIETWHDRRIIRGDEFAGRIGEEIERADVILLLVSPDFLNSDYCYDVEMKRAMERHDAGEARVMPVILRACDWHSAPFGKLLAAPKDGKPITSWADLDEAFLDVTLGIRQALEQLHGKLGNLRPSISVNQAAAPIGPRSSNLRVKKTFTDADQDRFLDDAFEFMARFFETSLAELKARNDGIDATFRRVDANRFTGVIYSGGKAVARCKIVRGGMFGRGITYAANDNASDNSINESMSVERDDQGLFLKAMGMAHYGGDQDRQLTFEGASEYYWAILMRPLQQR